jgi:diguanylate cyclase (GGDEF)-like protein
VALEYERKGVAHNDFTNSRVPQTLLLVDDVPANLDVLLEHLQDEQVRLLAATSGKDALRLAQQDPPDLILLDVMMPGMDGYEVLRQLKGHAATREVPVIFVTAMSDSVDEAKGLAMGAVDYIAKPFVVPVLKARVKNHLELKRKSDLLAHLAQIDGLTGISNRRHLETRLHQEWDRCQRHGRPLSLVMIDVDHFKQFNDHYGHGNGDDCLRHVSRALSACNRRSGDFLARYGGEEFIALLPDTTAVQGARVAGEMRKAVQSLGIAHRYSSSADVVTASLGVATVVPSKLITIAQLMEAADNALYLAKRAGRNCVRVAGE